MQQTNELT